MTENRHRAAGTPRPGGASAPNQRRSSHRAPAVERGAPGAHLSGKMETHQSFADSPPSPWVVRHAPLIRRGGTVLDLACGGGRHARWLAAQGFRVLAVDRDPAAIDALAGLAGVEARRLDLEGPDWPLAGLRFHGVVVARYLHRPRLFALAGLLAPDGVLIYETFMRGHEAYGSPRRPDFLLDPGELERFARALGLEIVDFREGFDPAGPAVTQSLCARRRAGPAF